MYSKLRRLPSWLVYLSVIGGFVFLWHCGPEGPIPSDGGDKEAPVSDKQAPPDSAPADHTSQPDDAHDARRPLPPLDLSQRLETGQVRAGIIRDKKEFIGGPLAQESIGDIKIYNDKVAFTIAGKRLTNGYLNYGGKIVAADIIRPKGQPSESLFQEFVVAFQHRMMKPEKIEIVNDGRNGKAAIVRIQGTDQELSLLLSYIRAYLPTVADATFPLGCQITYEFRLEPNSEILQFKISIKNNSKELQSIDFSEVAFFMGDGLQNFFPKRGYIDKDARGAWSYHGLSSKKVAYVIFPNPGEEFQVLLKYKTVLIGLQEAFDLDVGDTKVRTWNIAVGRDLAAAQAIYRRTLSGLKVGAIGGKVTNAASPTAAPLPDTIIHIQQRDAKGQLLYIGQAVSQADGSYFAELPVGTYLLSPQRMNLRSGPVEVTVTEGKTTTQNLQVKDIGTLKIEVFDESGAPMPSKVMIYRLGTPLPGMPSNFSPMLYGSGATKILFPYNGVGTTELPTGRYRLEISRGFFYELVQKEIEIKAGEETREKVTLKELIKLPKALTGDFHIHAQGSPDSQDRNTLKVAAMAGEGLTLAVSTDHEFVTDYQPTIEKLGMASKIRAVVGEEVTTYFGHFNTYPIPFKPDAVNNGAFQWYKLLAPGMFDLIRREAPGSIIQINHPIGIPVGAYFSHAGYDRDSGEAKRKPKEWSWNFDAIEVVNGNGFRGALTTTLPDWYSMLNRGHRLTAMGNSDSHNAFTSECGYPRNIITIGHNDPKKLTMTELAKAIKAQAVVVSGGAMIRLSASPDKDPANAVGLGQMLTLSGGEAHLHVKVEAASWVPLHQLDIIVNGKVAKTVVLPKKANSLVRYDDIISLKIDKDSWVIAMVQGNKPLPHVARGSRSFAFTNPIYLDADGDKRFTAPLKQKP